MITGHKQKLTAQLSAVRDSIATALTEALTLRELAALAQGDDFSLNRCDDYNLICKQISTLKRKADRLMLEVR